MTNPQTFRQKWGDDFFASRGFIQFPSALLEYVGDIGLTAADISVVLALLYWKFDGAPPYPSVATIADQLGKSPRAVQRTLRGLEERGWITIHAAYAPDGQQGANLVDFTPLRKAINHRGRLKLPSWALDKITHQIRLPYDDD